MNKKIYAITSVRNEADIIESFIRYTLKFVDGMVINENSSQDNTLYILEQLKKEGLSIDIIIDTNQKFNQEKKKNELLSYTMKKFSPDWILSLDADEFIFNVDYNNPREIILLLNPLVINAIKWETFVLLKENDKELFIPAKITHRRDNSDEYYKVIMSKELFQEGCVFGLGSHNLVCPKLFPKTIVSSNLKIAHYPIRSVEQLMSKVISGSFNAISEHSRETGRSFHLIKLLDGIVKKGSIGLNDLREESLFYAIRDRKIKISTTKNPLKYWFKDTINIKYPHDNTNVSFVTAVSVASVLIEKMREERDMLREENIVLKEKLLHKEDELEKFKLEYSIVKANNRGLLIEKMRLLKEKILNK